MFGPAKEVRYLGESVYRIYSPSSSLPVRQATFPSSIELNSELPYKFWVFPSDIFRFTWVCFMVVQLGINRFLSRIFAVFPNYKSLALGSHGIAHQVILKKLTVPFFLLLINDFALYLFDERTKISFAHLRR